MLRNKSVLRFTSVHFTRFIPVRTGLRPLLVLLRSQRQEPRGYSRNERRVSDWSQATPIVKLSVVSTRLRRLRGWTGRKYCFPSLYDMTCN